MSEAMVIEIGVEELPALPLLREAKKMKALWEEILNTYNLPASVDIYFTPRRIVLWHESFPTKQEKSVEALYGPPLSVAYKEGVATPAAVSFASKCGVELSMVGETLKDGKSVLFYEKQNDGVQSSELIQTMVEAFLAGLAFGKMMRWGSMSESFIRPVRWICALHGSCVLPLSLFGVKAEGKTFGHRQYSFDPLDVADAKSYKNVLASGNVILDQHKRKELILSQMRELEKMHHVTIEEDEELLDEVIAITEAPKALFGNFDEVFLTIPPEAIITSMKTNQRYFPVFKEGKLLNAFVVVSNALSDDSQMIIDGNERVLRARLSDALFFYNNDLQKGLDPSGLVNVMYMDGMGSLLDKSKREEVIASILNQLLGNGVSSEELRCAVSLAKADLLSEMVYEFTDLQGIMGRYYAQAMGLSEAVSVAIGEHYLPLGEESSLPTTQMGAIMAISAKLDTILALFALGKIPTGSKDPFALRRSALGIIKIIDTFGFDFDLSTLVESLKGHYPSALDTQKVYTFINDRLYQCHTCNSSVVSAVVASGEKSLLMVNQKIKALALVVEHDDFRENFATFKRVVNISKDVDLSCDLGVDEGLFEKEQERLLWSLFEDAAHKNSDNFGAKLQTLFALKPALDSFFEHVMVNVEDQKVKTNRLHLVASIAKEFKTIADIKEIAI